MRFLFFLLFISLGLLHAAGYSCNEAEWVANITDATTDQRASYSENSKGKDWYSRYFRFTTAVDGKIFIDVDKLSTRQKVSIQPITLAPLILQPALPIILVLVNVICLIELSLILLLIFKLLMWST